METRKKYCNFFYLIMHLIIFVWLEQPEKEWWRSWRGKNRKSWRKDLLTALQKEVDEELCLKLGKIEDILKVRD